MDQGRRQDQGHGQSQNQSQDRGHGQREETGRDRDHDRGDVLRWTVAALVLVALAIPWFLWGNDTVVAGLPVWLWWHVGWMALAGVAFQVFATRAWGVGIETSGTAGGTASDASELGPDTGGESR